MTLTRPLSLWVGLIRRFLAWVRSPLFDNVPRFRERLLARAVPKEKQASKFQNFALQRGREVSFYPLNGKFHVILKTSLNITKSH